MTPLAAVSVVDAGAVVESERSDGDTDTERREETASPVLAPDPYDDPVTIASTAQPSNNPKNRLQLRLVELSMEFLQINE